MQAPMSKLVRKMLDDRKLSVKLMQAILAERSNPDDVEKTTIQVDGKEFRLVRVSSINKTKE
jgi:hypothetical protein